MIPSSGAPMGGSSATGSKRARTADAEADVHVINPLTDERWDALIAQHPLASPFHQPGWLQALQRTYGYEPFVLTSAAPGKEMKNGMAFCRISSWITGPRAVSLPFADHCEPLVVSEAERVRFMAWLQVERTRQGWKYLEVRPLRLFQDPFPGWSPHHSYCFHELDLGPSLEKLFCGMHRDCIRRKVRRAEREGITYEVGRSAELLDAFYRLLLITRKRLRILPQPRSWFRNLLECIGENLQIRVARKDGRPIASILTLKHRRSVIYKYGCSDEKAHNLGGVPFLFWKLITESKAEGAETLDFGRSDLENEGLIRFKSEFGARQRNLTYYRSPGSEKQLTQARHSRTVGRVVSLLPDGISCAAGRMLYRHMG
jgi:CelD/BcsL family acetyltransferase involved in cellulose biosynthesis